MKAYCNRSSIKVVSHSSPKKVFRAISNALSDFYSREGMYFAGEVRNRSKGSLKVEEVDFSPTRKRYHHSVYSDFPEMRFSQENGDYITQVGKAPLHVRVNVVYNGEKERLEYSKNSDYPEKPARINTVSFTIFIDQVNDRQQQKERDRFFAHIQNECSRSI